MYYFFDRLNAKVQRVLFFSDPLKPYVGLFKVQNRIWCEGEDSNLSTFLLGQINIYTKADLSLGLEVSHHGPAETPPRTKRMN